MIERLQNLSQTRLPQYPCCRSLETPGRGTPAQPCFNLFLYIRDRLRGWGSRALPAMRMPSSVMYKHLIPIRTRRTITGHLRSPVYIWVWMLQPTQPTQACSSMGKLCLYVRVKCLSILQDLPRHIQHIPRRMFTMVLRLNKTRMHFAARSF